MSELKKAKSFYYPPGGILIWIIVFVELITFSAVTLVYLSERNLDIEGFNASQQLLNKNFGLINTVILLSSSLFMAMSIIAIKTNEKKKSVIFLALTILLGVLFLVLKGIEYQGKIDAGLSLSYSTFFQFYWLLTAFHFIHVIVGVFLISYMLFYTQKDFYNQSNYEDVETVGIFWHMCDLIWVFLFPIIYLLH